jgi:hypothetical protein
MEGQLLFGEPFQGLESSGVCLKVRRLFRSAVSAGWGSMQGWIDNHCVPAALVSEEEALRVLHSAPRGIVASTMVRATAVSGEYGDVALPLGVLLPDYDPERRTFMLGGAVFRVDEPGCVVAEALSPRVSSLLDVLRQFDGVQYLWGGQTGWGVDCSGLTQSVARFFGVELPRNSSEQIKVGREIRPVEARTGDLAFFGRLGSTSGVASHVGFLCEGSDGRWALYHAKQRVKCQILESSMEGAGGWVYPEGVGAVALVAIRRPIEFT